MKQIFICILILIIYKLPAQAPATIPEKPEMVFVKGGTFNMGSNSGESDEKPVHNVTLSSYSIGKYEVTVGQYKAFCTATGRAMPYAPSWGWNDKHPMVNVSYNEAVSYCNWLGEKFGGDWRLPTEAEWEYAARGGNNSNGYTYAGGDKLENLGWFADNAGEQTQAVGRKKPNELGLYDMSGNVLEWCSDWYDAGYYATSPATNPKGSSSGKYRVLRGGSLYNDATYCRVANRNSDAPAYRSDDCGFRVVLSQYTVLKAPANIPVKPEVIYVEGGTFNMGSISGESNEKPVHSVTLSSYSIGKYEVTVGQYKAFCTATGRAMPEAPEWGWNDKHPMVNVNYNDAVSYCNWLGEKYGGDWRLPTEAEWEFAARGGNKSKGYNYSGSNTLKEVGWYADNADGQTHEIGSKKPNELGLFDMSGNVYEWCKDWPLPNIMPLVRKKILEDQ